MASTGAGSHCARSDGRHIAGCTVARLVTETAIGRESAGAGTAGRTDIPRHARNACGVVVRVIRRAAANAHQNCRAILIALARLLGRLAVIRRRAICGSVGGDKAGHARDPACSVATVAADPACRTVVTRPAILIQTAHPAPDLAHLAAVGVSQAYTPRRLTPADAGVRAGIRAGINTRVAPVVDARQPGRVPATSHEQSQKHEAFHPFMVADSSFNTRGTGVQVRG